MVLYHKIKCDSMAHLSKTVFDKVLTTATPSHTWRTVTRAVMYCSFPQLPKPVFPYRDTTQPATIRESCHTAVKPSSWVAVDEGMTAFSGCSKDKVLLKNKPILEGYKIWQFGSYGGYTWSYLFYSGSNGSKGIGAPYPTSRDIGSEDATPRTEDLGIRQLAGLEKLPGV